MSNQKPCLVQTTQGFSVLYNEKYLYSKYNPQRTILNQIEQLDILPGTLFLCCSPVLPYGLIELSKKMGENCWLLAIELEDNLNSFIFENKASYKDIANLSLLTKKEAFDLPSILLENNYTFLDGTVLPKAGTFKRVISLNFSGGTVFAQNTYNTLHAYCQNAIMTFWKNRMTLTKFGRKYCQDFFMNLKILSKTKPISSFFNSVNKSIIVFGSAESLDDGIKFLRNSKEDYYILCADTALQPLLDNNIKVDGVFIEEAQTVILKAFIGTQSSNTQIFAGLSSIPVIAHNFNEKHISFFTTEFAKATFLSQLYKKNFIPPVNPPFGSVGLTAFFYALKFRANDSIPIFTYGLDFAYTAGRTHGNGTLAHKNQLTAQNRIKSIYNFASAFNQTTSAFNTEDGKKLFTTPVLNTYAQLFNNIFSTQKNCFSSSKLSSLVQLQFKEPFYVTIQHNDENTETAYQEDEINKYLSDEKDALIELKDILTGKIKLATNDANKRIRELAEPREYLYLHFPDGHQFSLSQDFLNRIRVQIDFFLKQF